MDQSLATPLDGTAQKAFTPEVGEFNYRPVPIFAPVALFLGLCSFLGLFALVGLGVGLFGLLLGLVCIYHIGRAKGELGGMGLAIAGFTLSTVFFVSGTVAHVHAYRVELPPGFERVNFSREISKKGFRIEGAGMVPHPDLKQLNGKKIFLKGYMYPEQQTENLTGFLLVKDNQQCCFGGNPSLNDMILVKMAKGNSVNFDQGLVAVAGTFHALGRPLKGPAELQPLMVIEATHFEKARTSF